MYDILNGFSFNFSKVLWGRDPWGISSDPSRRLFSFYFHSLVCERNLFSKFIGTFNLKGERLIVSMKFGRKVLYFTRKTFRWKFLYPVPHHLDQRFPTPQQEMNQNWIPIILRLSFHFVLSINIEQIKSNFLKILVYSVSIRGEKFESGRMERQSILSCQGGTACNVFSILINIGI